MSPDNKEIISIIGILIVGSAFILGSLYILRNLIKSILAIDWPKADGKVIKSKLEKEEFDDDYTANITYKYSVNDIEYQSSCVTFGPTLNWKSTSKYLVSRFRNQQKVQVFYNPNKPEECCLIPWFHWIYFEELLSLIIFGPLGYFFLSSFINKMFP
ncbi:DUF3592 domain-containing protein [Pleionea sp. CnH1-48]|uniref:DUF3592 domain-containing protein n=1 Tax=Pleionea sp. CnH1-48 TaxID=2954494 RepID=UPI002097E145|nr:DUF3592 domain-containing protein [Pleionea sp. CnH1-48]MCO7224133.1 DUF3592 domain-containing protein [Pleionea sp. CnH1-48]